MLLEPKGMILPSTELLAEPTLDEALTKSALVMPMVSVLEVDVNDAQILNLVNDLGPAHDVGAIFLKADPRPNAKPLVFICIHVHRSYIKALNPHTTVKPYNSVGRSDSTLSHIRL